MEDMKDIPKLGYTSPREAIAEKFHMSEQLLAMLNPGERFNRAGDTIVVVDTGGDQERAGKADRVEVNKTRQTVTLFDKSNSMIAFYPATVGSEEKPSPTGTLKVTEISRNPTYRYNPAYRFKGCGPPSRSPSSRGRTIRLVQSGSAFQRRVMGCMGRPLQEKYPKPSHMAACD